MATILLVDSERIIRTLVGVALRNRDHRVLEAATGRGALSRARRSADGIDLLVTDIALPGTNGLELDRALRSEMPELRSLFLSRYPHAIQLENEARLAGEVVVREPFDIKSLVEKVDECLGGWVRKPPSRLAGSGSAKPKERARA